MLVVLRDGSQVRYDSLKVLRCAVPGAVEVMLPMLPASLQRGHGAHMEARICGLIMRKLRETRLETERRRNETYRMPRTADWPRVVLSANCILRRRVRTAGYLRQTATYKYRTGNKHE